MRIQGKNTMDTNDDTVIVRKIDRATQLQIDQLRLMYMDKYPLWSCVVCDMRVLVQTHTTYGMDMRSLTKVGATDYRTVYLLPDFWDNSTINIKVGVIAHEFEHIIRMHSTRMEARDPDLWNQATDHMINLGLLANGDELPADGLFDKKYEGWEEERIYLDLAMSKAKQGSKPQHGQPGSSSPSLDGDGQPIMGPDTQDGNGPSPRSILLPAKGDDGNALSPDQINQVRSEICSKIKMAESMAKQFGKNSGGLSLRSLDSIVDPKRSWREEMRLFVTKKGVSVGRTWSRLDRRALSMGIWVPAEVKEGLDWVVVGFDVSSSTSQRETDAFIANVMRIRQSMPIARMTVVPFNTGVIEDGVFDIKPWGKFTTSFKFGGGTNVQPLFDWLEAKTCKPDCVMVFSDMEFNMKLGPFKPKTLWVSTTPLKKLGKKVPSFGRVIEIGV